MRLFLSIFTLLVFFSANAQTLCFEADVTRGCAPLSVNISDCSIGVPPESILYNFEYNLGDPIGGSSDTFYTYSNPGLYTVLQIGNVNGQGDTSIRIDYIEVLPSPDPLYSAFRCDSNRVVVKILDNQYEEYRIYWGDGSTNTISGSSDISHKYLTQGTKTISIRGNYIPGNCGDSISFNISTLDIVPEPILNNFQYSITGNEDSISFDFNTTEGIDYILDISPDTLTSFNTINSFTAIGTPFTYLDTSENGYCYRLKTRDACFNEKFSETICTVKLDAFAENNSNTISWQPYPLPGSIIAWELFKNQQSYSQFNPLIQEIEVKDTQVVCNQQYCYQLEAELFGGVKSISNEICVRGLSLDTPSAVESFNVSIENNQTQLDWLPDTLADLYLVRRGFLRTRVFDSTDQSNYNLDPPIQDLPRICYSIDFYDQCRNLSENTGIHCPVEIKVENTQNENRLVTWLSYQGWPFGVEKYFLEKLNENNVVYFTEEFDNTVNEYTDTGVDTTVQKLKYRIKALSAGPDSLISYSLIYEIEQTFKLFFPTAFSPNGDGLNDVFEPIGLFAEEYELIIFNRWGELIFASRDFDRAWDGTINERDAPEGVYVYKVSAKDELGRSFSEKSTVTLTR